ncbi:alkene reductase [Xanthomonas arboricola pv. juglandis]|jgi:N-ethylmaleimide reductase|uniref:Alkene reductase n=1 Tax=Xanthomonas euroxanthea TaxID=2259622 RepID=A0A6V7MSZ1_9XANT|nr:MULTISPECIES: alkene reductase [Xanthomonas]PPT31480.1 alkene reductase [Xanthomonas arboricola]SYZ54313.1 alkene reductase [Xanthomonas arboricola pv. juglandis]MBB3779469.1 N-ethylmaleimide reductase [Xanthomonas euroxanthea]MBB3811935.1 N-ethylmaleimide reductase [Xanthomonas euroxanthea]MBB5767461.1 N-ethylmaleimide reductase [Xanthomonas euroxanthea]
MSTSTESPLFSPVRLGALDLANRVIMAPLTRNRAVAGQVPSPLAAEYYGQRASAGLIVAEGTQISPLGQGYLDTPGIHTAAQVQGWRAVTDEVHRRGGKIVLQLWHVGRVSHTSVLPPGESPVAPSAIRAEGKTYTKDGFQDVSEPRALALDEIPALIEDYRIAARNAIDAGFDGVEVHAANGYLLDQFLRDGSNQRTDAYGGDIENRTRLLTEVMQAIADEIGAERTGVRLSPVTPVYGMHDSDPQPLFERAVERLNLIGGLAFVHVIEGATGGARDNVAFDYAALRARFDGAWIANNSYDKALSEKALDSGYADAIAFGRPFIANPDLVRRLRENAPLADVDQATLYGGGAKGYIDYPALPD